ncbi:MAG: DUF1080 domain-containing protein [Saprospiraceae bacterium]|nr:DUF1080 domain-containing protein [Saprospiraceae bacterium]
MSDILKRVLLLFCLLIVKNALLAQELEFKPLFNGKDLSGWVDVNTSPETWKVENGELICTGLPIGVMRSEKQYENFILEIEWKHMEAGGNSGIFIWSEGTPFSDDEPLTKAMEVQMLELEWSTIHNRTDDYVHGELFPTMGMTAIPDNPRGDRSKSIEKRCKGKGEWNKYIVVAVDGTVKLSVNGKFVNGIRNSQRKKGYLCLEAEGSEIHFRNIRIMELPGGVITPDQIAPVVE